MQSKSKKTTAKESTDEKAEGESQLREKNRLIQSLLDCQADNILSVDSNYCYTAFNYSHAQTMRSLYGANIQLGSNLLDHISLPEFRLVAKQKLDQAFTIGEPFIDNHFLVTVGESQFYFDVYYSPLKDENGVLLGMNISAKDVTQLKENTDIVQNYEASYRALFEDINSVILLVNPVTATILDANIAACNFYGYSHSELTSLKITDLAVLPQAETLARVRQVASGTLHNMRHAHRLANGEIREVEIHAGTANFSGHHINVAIIHDVSRLRLSEERYKTLFKNFPIPTYTWQHTDGDFFLIDYNDAAQVKTGEKIKELSGRSASELYKNEPEILKELSECYNSHETRWRETSIKLSSTEIDHFLIVTCVYISPDLILVHTEDITERKKLIEKLVENEEKLNQILSNSQDVPYRRNLKTEVYDYMGPFIEKITGFTSVDIMTMTTEMVLEQTHPEDRAAIEQMVSESESNPGESYELVYRFRHKYSGQYCWFQDRFTTLVDSQGLPAFRIGNVCDITQRKLAEEKKQEAEFQLQSLFEQAHDAIFILDLQGSHLAVNQRAADMMGYTIEEMRGLSLNQTSAETQKSRQVLQQLLNGEHIPLYERLFKKKDGTIFPVEINVELVRDSHGNPLHIQSVIRDISERKAAEEKLRESEDRYRTFVEHSFDAIAFADDLGNITEWNYAAENLTGLKRENVLNMPYWEIQLQLIPAELRTAEHEERFKTSMLEMIETGQSPFFNRINVVELVRPDGTKRSVEQIVFPVKKKNGYGIRSVAHDITERKIAEEELQDSEERFRLLFERSQATMLVIEPASGEILNANPAAANFYGYSIDQLRGMAISQINTLPKDTISAELQLALKEERNFFVFPHRLANGDIRSVEVHSSPLSLKGRQVLFSIVHDITKRKQVEEKLLESEERFSTAFHSSQEAISISRLSDGVYIDVNDAFCSIFEISRGQVIGRSSKDVNFWENPEQRNELFKTVRENGDITNFELQYHTTTGRLGFMYASISRINIAGEECILIFGRDVTAQKKAENDLRAAHEELEQRVRERTVELQTAIASLEKAAQVKDEFLSIMGHELRTPLNIMLGSAQLLEEEVYGPLNPKQAAAITSIETSGEKLLMLLNDILDLSKLQNKEISLNMAPCSLGEICRSVLKSTASSSEKKQLQASFSTTPHEIIIHADKLRVEQIIFNLYSNAIKFTSTGGQVGIDILGNRENKNVKVIVWDTGIGIQEENLPRLFLPFTQLDARLARDYEGSGLGLALSKQLAELFGGNISVESVYGQGSRFTLTLPWME